MTTDGITANAGPGSMPQGTEQSRTYGNKKRYDRDVAAMAADGWRVAAVQFKPRTKRLIDRLLLRRQGPFSVQVRFVSP